MKKVHVFNSIDNSHSYVHGQAVKVILMLNTVGLRWSLWLLVSNELNFRMNTSIILYH